MNCKNCGNVLNSTDVICPNCKEAVNPPDLVASQVPGRISPGQVEMPSSSVDANANKVISNESLDTSSLIQNPISNVTQSTLENNQIVQDVNVNPIANNPNAVVQNNANTIENNKKKTDVKFIIIVTILSALIIALGIFIGFNFF